MFVIRSIGFHDRPMDLQQMRYVLAVAETPSFTCLDALHPIPRASAFLSLLGVTTPSPTS